MLVNLTITVLAGLTRIRQALRPSSGLWRRLTDDEEARLLGIVGKPGPLRVGRDGSRGFASEELVEKNEYLRIVNEEMIKLTQSLEAANNELESTRDYLNNLIQNSADMIVSTGRRRSITLFNRRAEEILGYRPDEVVGQPVDVLYPEGEAARVERNLMASPSGQLMEHDVRLRTKEGLTIPARLTASLLYDPEGKPIGSVGACTDLTQVKALEEEILRQQKLLAIAELGGAASHELNQPLTVALGRIQLLLRKEGENLLPRENLIHVERELKRMAEMVRRIGQITRYQTKPYVGESRIIDLERSGEVNVGKGTV